MENAYIDVKLIACKARTRRALAEEMGVSEDDLTWESVVNWSNALPDDLQPRHASLTYVTDGAVRPGELVLVPYGKNFTMLGVVSGHAGGEHPLPHVAYKSPLLSLGELQ